MIKVYQGDTSDIIVLQSHESFVLTDDWNAQLVIVSSTDNVRPLLTKCFSKDKEKNIFYTALLPTETSQLPAGKYVLGFQITNDKYCYRKEIHEKLKIMPQVVWNTTSENPSGYCPPVCPYTTDGLPPSGDKIWYDEE